jgi:hypothetical protein
MTRDAAPGDGTDTQSVRVVSPGNSTTAMTLVKLSEQLFIGRAHAPTSEGVYRVERAPGDAATPSDAAHLVVASDAEPGVRTDGDALRALASAHGGTFVESTDIGPLARTLRQSLSAHGERVPRRPMRWAGWAILLAGILGAEWWARRRNGLR